MEEDHNQQIQNRQKQNKKRSHHTYRKLKKVGQGNFGNAFLAQSETDRKFYIIKVIRNQKTLEQKENILKQVKVMKLLRHQYVIAYRQSFLDKNKDICIVMEYAENGDLESRICAQKKLGVQFDQQQIWQWFIQICFGLKYIHENKIVHRDLKSENIFLTSKNECKIGDFGISKIMEQTFDLAKTKIGTPFVMAPQIWQNNRYNQKSDIWSLGCILYELCTLKRPFVASNAGSIYIKIANGHFQPIQTTYSKQLIDLVKELLNKHPQDRPSVQKILQKQFIKKRISSILSKTFSRYQETLRQNDTNAFTANSLLKSKNKNSSSHSQYKRSFSSSIKNSNFPLPLTEQKIKDKLEKVQGDLLQYKLNYPLVIQENKSLKQQNEKIKKQQQEVISKLQQIKKYLDRDSNVSVKQLKKCILEMINDHI